MYMYVTEYCCFLEGHRGLSDWHITMVLTEEYHRKQMWATDSVMDSHTTGPGFKTWGVFHEALLTYVTFKLKGF